jgi:hypothetical protein
MIWLADAANVSWLTLEPDHGVLQPGERQAIRITAHTRTLQVGEHSVTLTFSAEGDNKSMSSNAMSKISVVADERGQQASEQAVPLPLQPRLHFGGIMPQSTKTLMMEIYNPDDHAVTWNIHIGNEKPGLGTKRKLDHEDGTSTTVEPFDLSQANGVTVSESMGTLSPHQSTTVFVTANAAQLEADHAYSTNLTLTSSVDNASTAIKSPISFFVNAIPLDNGGPKPPPKLPPAIKLTIGPGATSASTVLNLPNDNSATMQVEAVSAVPWLTLNPPAATLDANSQATINLTATRSGLNQGFHTTDLQITLNWHPANGHVTRFPIQVMVEVQ